MGYYKNTGFIESRPPSKPIQWKEVSVKKENFEKCIIWCEINLGEVYKCWPLGGDRWGSNKGLWKYYDKHKENVTRFCFRDEKVRLEAELKFG
jgi:hypothetical protein